MTTLTLAEFLLARIAEDERVAQDVRLHEYLTSRDASALERGDRGGYGTVFATSGRVLAECEAKRRIVEGAEAVSVGESTAERVRSATLAHVLRLLALPYADHPDYREEWRP